MTNQKVTSLLSKQKEYNELSSVAEVFQKIIHFIEAKDHEESKSLVFTVKDAAEELQVSIPTLRDHFLCRPDFPKIRAGSKVLIPRKALEDWLNVSK